MNCASGAFWHTFQDAYVPGNGLPLDFSRTYSSLDAGTDGPLGYGWSDTYAMHLSFDSSGNPTVTEANGAQVPFYANGSGGYVAPPRVLASLSANGDGTYTYSRYLDHDQYVFTSSGQLIKEIDPNGYTTTLTYTGGQLTSVTDASGRSLSIAYNGSRISSITDPAANKWTYTYDQSGNLQSVTGPDNRTWSYTYDQNHLLLTMTDPDAGTLTNAYNTQDQVIKQVDPANRTTTWSYTGDPTTTAGSTTTITDPAGNVTVESYQLMQLQSVTRGYGTSQAATTSYQYDPTLGLTQITDPDGNVTRNTYDAYGNLLTSTAPGGRETVYTYNNLNEVLTKTDPLNRQTTYTYDSAGNLLTKSTPIGSQTQTWSWTYGDSSLPGDPTKITDPDDNSSSLGYDSHGDLTSVTDAAGNETTYTYDQIGERQTMVSPAGNAAGGSPAAHTTSFSYDAPFELTKVTDPLGHSTSYAYNGDGALTSTTTPTGHQTSYVLNADNEVTETDQPIGTLKTSYNADGTIHTETDGDGNVTTYTYNPLGLVASVSDPKSRTTSYAYNLDGDLTSLTDPESRTTTYGYDANNELTSIAYSDGVTPNVTYGYDSDGERTTMTDGTGTTTYSHDSLGRLTGASNPNGPTVGYGYDLVGNETSITYPNGKSVTAAYNADEQIKSVTDWLGNQTSFAYDPDSNLTTTTYPAGTGNTDSYGYDNADELTSIKDTQGASTLTSTTYTRNADGNLTTSSETGLAEPSSQPTNSYSYDNANNPTQLDSQTGYQYDTADELTSSPAGTYGYDSLGERTSFTPTGGAATSYAYNQAGQLDQVTPASGSPSSYGYNGTGLLTSSKAGSTTQNLAWNDTTTLPLLFTDGNQSYIYGPDNLPVEQISTGGTVNYLHHDQLGSTRLITSATGAAIGSLTYTPYGKLIATSGTATSGLGYAGQYDDPNTGLIYLRARNYDPTTGQFLTRDPLEELTQQPYSYTNDNPINGTDRTGLGCGLLDPGGCINDLAGTDVGGNIVNAANQLSDYAGIASGACALTMFWNGVGEACLIAGGIAGAVNAATDVAQVFEGCRSLGAAAISVAGDGLLGVAGSKLFGYGSDAFDEATALRDSGGLWNRAVGGFGRFAGQTARLGGATLNASGNALSNINAASPSCGCS